MPVAALTMEPTVFRTMRDRARALPHKRPFVSNHLIVAGVVALSQTMLFAKLDYTVSDRIGLIHAKRAATLIPASP
jgi:hypothetical protein